MARERWFWAQARQRRGPVLLPELVELVLGQPDPRAVLVWRKGLAEWTRAEDVPEVQGRIAPFVARREAEEGTARRGGAHARVPAEPLPAPPPPAPAGSNLAVYGGIAAGLLLMGLLGWLFWPRPAAAPQAVPLGGSSAENAPAVVLPRRCRSRRRTGHSTGSGGTDRRPRRACPGPRRGRRRPRDRAASGRSAQAARRRRVVRR